ncbi:ankyrin repeat domain-containing protein SOWAHB [Eublepharis macularius]|uniref:Ankyrin repeat domain-containing protein SOWAHB n=1 Tax=Eublepharis macularius TaxID=481883 RepID=A0AA97JZX4_EUBMA|nr:ankyrin repeat domain-containing protein SOWAHB [Eublepharis macularius]
MAQELSQAELLDFLCQAGGRVPNAALLGHFRRFLRDPDASPERLQRRRERFKGFVNSVATVKQEGPGAAKYVVLRKRYRDLVGEEPKTRAAAQAPLHGPGGRAGGAPRAPGECPRNRPAAAEQEERPGSRTCPGSAQDLRASPGPGERSGARLSPSGQQRPPARGALPGGEARSQENGWAGPPGDPPALRGGAPQPPGPPSPVGGLQQRICEWVAGAPRGPLQPDAFPEARPPAHSPCPSPPLEPQPPGREERRESFPVFRSIRCQLSLQDLDDFIEQESEDSSSASGGSDSCRGEGEVGALSPPPAGGQNGWAKNPPGAEGLSGKPQANGLAEAGSWTGTEGLSSQPRANGLAKKSGPPQGAAVPGRLVLPGWIARGPSSEDELLERDSKRPNGHLPKPGKMAHLPPPDLDAPLSPQLVPRQRHPGSTGAVEGPDLDRDGSPEHRSSVVPLEPREHAWLVKVATGSWLQARALFLEDPHLATRKDFISGYTVLHWLAKHGSAQVLLDFVTGARKAGVDLDVNVKSGCGYTPLHLAAMHGHQLVIRLLVQKLRCQVQVRDGSGKKPWQYLSSTTSGEIWQLLGAPKGKTIFPTHPIARNASPARRGKSPELARKISRKTSLAAYLKPQHIKWKMANKYPALQEREEDSD